MGTSTKFLAETNPMGQEKNNLKVKIGLFVKKNDNTPNQACSDKSKVIKISGELTPLHKKMVFCPPFCQKYQCQYLNKLC